MTELHLVEQEVKDIYQLQEVEWSVFLEAVHKMSTLVKGEYILYGNGGPSSSLIARQSDGVYEVVSRLLPLEKRNLGNTWREQIRTKRGQLHLQEESIRERLKAFNQAVEEQALIDHFRSNTVKVTPNESGLPDVDPKCFYPRVYLHFGELITERYAESMMLFSDALELLRRSFRSGSVSYQDGVLEFEG